MGGGGVGAGLGVGVGLGGVGLVLGVGDGFGDGLEVGLLPPVVIVAPDPVLDPEFVAVWELGGALAGLALVELPSLTEPTADWVFVLDPAGWTARFDVAVDGANLSPPN